MRFKPQKAGRIPAFMRSNPQEVGPPPALARFGQQRTRQARLIVQSDGRAGSSLGPPGVSAIATGGYHACAIVNNTAQCSGLNNQAQLGSDINAKRSPQRLRLRHSAAAAAFGCGIRLRLRLQLRPRLRLRLQLRPRPFNAAPVRITCPRDHRVLPTRHSLVAR